MSNPTDPFQNASELGKMLQDGVTQIQAENLAKVVRTFHQAYLDAGFTDEQSYGFVLQMMTQGSGGSS